LEQVTGIVKLLQGGAGVCVNRVVPQTGIAVEGVCPGFTQGWPAVANAVNTAIRFKKYRFIKAKEFFL
jgi:hypothetical protein